VVNYTTGAVGAGNQSVWTSIARSDELVFAVLPEYFEGMKVIVVLMDSLTNGPF